MNRALLLVMLLLTSSLAASADPDLLAPDQAFRFSARLLDIDRLEVRYVIAPGYYMYRDKFRFEAEGAEIELDAPQFPVATVKTDKFFGPMQIYRGNMHLTVPFKVVQPGTARLVLKAVSQGCADIGVCYPPHEQRAQIDLTTLTSSPAQLESSPFLPRTQPPANLEPELRPAADTEIAKLFKGDFWPLVLSFFGFGVLLALTPCMLPMIPILSGVLAPHGERLTRARGLALALCFVVGMAITYAVIGVIAGLLGTMLSATLQQPWVLTGFAAIFVLLALSMFGFYDLQLPARWQTRLAEAGNKLHGGHYASVFAMGVLSGLLIGPCVAAPLAGALLYIGQSGDTVLGGTALFAMAIGMGIPLIAVGVSAGSLLPKAGPWTELVKRFFGVVLLGVALYLMSSVVSPAVYMSAWAALLIVFSIYLRAIDPLPDGAAGYRRFFKGIGVITLALGLALLVGALSGARDALQPLAGFRADSGEAVPLVFRGIENSAQLDSALANAAGTAVVLDFYADWCVACKEMERDTFSDPTVRSQLQKMARFRVDVTEGSEAQIALLKRFGLFGPPGFVFFDRGGKEIEGLRVKGFEPAPKFAAILELALRQQ